MTFSIIRHVFTTWLRVIICLGLFYKSVLAGNSTRWQLTVPCNNAPLKWHTMADGQRKLSLIRLGKYRYEKCSAVIAITLKPERYRYVDRIARVDLPTPPTGVAMMLDDCNRALLLTALNIHYDGLEIINTNLHLNCGVIEERKLMSQHSDGAATDKNQTRDKCLRRSQGGLLDVMKDLDLESYGLLLFFCASIGGFIGSIFGFISAFSDRRSRFCP